MTYFLWHRHEDDNAAGKSGVSVRPLLCRLCCARVENGVVNRNLILKRGRSMTSVKGGEGGGL